MFSFKRRMNRDYVSESTLWINRAKTKHSRYLFINKNQLQKLG